MRDPTMFTNSKFARIFTNNPARASHNLVFYLMIYSSISLFWDVMILAVGGGEGMVALMEIDFRGKRDVERGGWGG